MAYFWLSYPTTVWVCYRKHKLFWGRHIYCLIISSSIAVEEQVFSLDFLLRCYKETLYKWASLTPSIYLDIIEKHSTLGENQFTEKPLKKRSWSPINWSIWCWWIDRFKLTVHILLILLMLSCQIISPRLLSGTKNEMTLPWQPERAKVKTVNL